MHPILADRRRLGLYVVGWVPVAGVLVSLLVLAGARWGAAAALVVPLVPPFASVCLSSWYACRAFPLQEAPLPLVLGTQVGGAALSSALWTFMARQWATTLDAWFPGIAPLMQREAPLFLGLGALLYLLSATLHYVIVALDEQQAAERRALEVKVLAREAELTALRAQLQPHFLFNSLNSISALTAVDAEGARRMCLLLADFLRRSLTLGARPLITVGDELTLVSSFLAVEKVRFGSRLEVELRVDDGAGPCLIPPLLLQPLVENAVSHGIAHAIGGGAVVIEARRGGERLEIAVANPCDPERPHRPGTGVGLANVRRRLEALHGGAARMTVRDEPTAFRVELSLPAVVAP